jgi:hypothetical protein
MRNIGSLRALARRPSETLRLLNLEKLTGLTTLAHLAACHELEQLGLYESQPADKRLDVLLEISALRHVVVGDVYPLSRYRSCGTASAATRCGIEPRRSEEISATWPSGGASRFIPTSAASTKYGRLVPVTGRSVPGYGGKLIPCWQAIPLTADGLNSFCPCDNSSGQWDLINVYFGLCALTKRLASLAPSGLAAFRRRLPFTRQRPVSCSSTARSEHLAPNVSRE